MSVHDDPRCTICRSDLDANDGAHYHGCGNAGFYADEPPTIADPATVATPDNPDWSTMTGSEIVRHEFGPSGRFVARSRRESDPCEVGTVGCCIDHSEDDGGCETW